MSSAQLKIVVPIAFVIVAVLLATQNSGVKKTYLTQGGPSAEQIKAAAAAQTAMDGTLNARADSVMSTLLAYDGQRRNYQTSILKIKTDAGVTKYQTDAATKLGMEGLKSTERMTNKALEVEQQTTNKQIEAADKMNQRDNETQQQNGVLNFFGNLIGGFFRLILP